MDKGQHLVSWPIGTKVRMVCCAEAMLYPDKVWVTRSEPWMVCGTQSVLLKGFGGCFATEFLEPVKEDI